MSPRHAERTRSASASYSRADARPSHGAEHRPMPASTQAARTARRSDRRSLHWRRGTASWIASRTVSAWRCDRSGPRYAAPSSRTSRTTDSRGYASRVSLSQTARSGNFERRLYRGLCAAMSRSSRTCASSGWAHSIGSTRSASPTISPILLRVSLATKY